MSLAKVATQKTGIVDLWQTSLRAESGSLLRPCRRGHPRLPRSRAALIPGSSCRTDERSTRTVNRHGIVEKAVAAADRIVVYVSNTSATPRGHVWTRSRASFHGTKALDGRRRAVLHKPFIGSQTESWMSSVNERRFWRGTCQMIG